ncbi:MAG TPA: DUF1801 domain-containing protein [Candidatus Acidoferrum sp.]|jgi:uncharacterized protein YdhG (YjbR/CyaY superfamily)
MKKPKEGQKASVLRAQTGKKFTRAKAGSAKTVDEYLARLPEPSHIALEELRATIRSIVPTGTVETISYSIPAFKHNGIIVWFAGFAKHCSLFPTAAIIDEFQAELRDFKLSKGTIQFTAEKPLPAALVKRIIKARLAKMNHKKSR